MMEEEISKQIDKDQLRKVVETEVYMQLQPGIAPFSKIAQELKDTQAQLNKYLQESAEAEVFRHDKIDSQLEYILQWQRDMARAFSTHVDVYKNNGKEWKMAKDEISGLKTENKELTNLLREHIDQSNQYREEMRPLVRGMRENIEKLTLETAPIIKVTHNAQGFAGFIAMIRDNIWPIAFVVLVISFLMGKI